MEVLDAPVGVGMGLGGEGLGGKGVEGVEEVLERVDPEKELVLVLVRREDVFAQAVSYAKAVKWDTWRGWNTREDPVHVDPEVMRYFARLQSEVDGLYARLKARWPRVIEVSYEADLNDAYGPPMWRALVMDVWRGLGVDFTLANTLDLPAVAARAGFARQHAGSYAHLCNSVVNVDQLREWVGDECDGVDPTPPTHPPFVTDFP